jgi:uncharacterized protein (TIGR02147 family)
MIKLSVFEFKDYKKFIIDWMTHSPNNGRGLRKQLAEAIYCQTAYITQVLSGDNHLSLEQAEATTRWMGLANADAEFFLLLVLFQRAGTKSLQKVLSKQITERRELQANLQKRIQIHDTLSQADQIKYYSSWQYAAIHIALLVPGLQTIEGLQNHFHLPLSQIRNVLDFLAQCGFIKQEKNFFKVVKPMLHLELDSPLLQQHHTHWRLKVIESLTEKKNSNLHYSGAISLAEDDFEWVREKLSQLLEEIIARIKDSKDEKIAALNFDWFEI